MGIVLQWWLIFLLMGLGFLPLTTYVFRGFDDGGWMFAKTIGLFLVSWLVWTLNCTGLALFQQSTIVITLLVLAAVNYAALFIFRKMRTKRRVRALGLHHRLQAGGLRDGEVHGLRLYDRDDALAHDAI